MTTATETRPEIQVIAPTPASISHSFVKGNVTREQLGSFELPERTQTYEPVPYDRFVELAVEALNKNGLEVISERHEVVKKGGRYFGHLIARRSGDEGIIQRAVGLRSSYDKSLPIGIAAGEQVTVCSNLCFGGELTVFRKHTKNVWEDIVLQIDAAVERSCEEFDRSQLVLNSLREISPTNQTVHDLLIKALIGGVISSQRIKQVYNEYVTPSYDEFRGRTAFDLRQAFTHLWKGDNQVDQFVERGQSLDRLFRHSFRPELIEAGAITENSPDFSSNFDAYEAWAQQN